MENLRKEDGKKLLIWAWVCIAATLITPLFAIAGAILGHKYKKYDEKVGSRLVTFSIIFGILVFYFSLKIVMGW